MIYIPAGELIMNPRPVQSHHKNPPYKVVFKKGFFIGKYPITQAQRQAIMGNNCHPSAFKGADRPVERISWHHAQEFCYSLSRIVKKDYRLPSEAEWEYACRAGTKTKYYFGDDESKLGDYAWYGEDRMFQRGFWTTETSPVGLKQPNPWGLYDMSGNIWEWCEDDEDDYERSNAYEGILDGSARVNIEINVSAYGDVAKVIRGGSWRISKNSVIIPLHILKLYVSIEVERQLQYHLLELPQLLVLGQYQFQYCWLESRFYLLLYQDELSIHKLDDSLPNQQLKLDIDHVLNQK